MESYPEKSSKYSSFLSIAEIKYARDLDINQKKVRFYHVKKLHTKGNCAQKDYLYAIQRAVYDTRKILRFIEFMLFTKEIRKGE